MFIFCLCWGAHVCPYVCPLCAHVWLLWVPLCAHMGPHMRPIWVPYGLHMGLIWAPYGFHLGPHTCPPPMFVVVHDWPGRQGSEAQGYVKAEPGETSKALTNGVGQNHSHMEDLANINRAIHERWASQNIVKYNKIQ